MTTAKIVWNGVGEQQKSFEDLWKAVMWCSKNHNKLVYVNDHYTGCKQYNDEVWITMLEKGEE